EIAGFEIDEIDQAGRGRGHDDLEGCGTRHVLVVGDRNRHGKGWRRVVDVRRGSQRTLGVGAEGRVGGVVSPIDIYCPEAGTRSRIAERPQAEVGRGPRGGRLVARGRDHQPGRGRGDGDREGRETRYVLVVGDPNRYG